MIHDFSFAFLAICLLCLATALIVNRHIFNWPRITALTAVIALVSLIIAVVLRACHVR